MVASYVVEEFLTLLPAPAAGPHQPNGAKNGAMEECTPSK
jgi:hypothetical protein